LLLRTARFPYLLEQALVLVIILYISLELIVLFVNSVQVIFYMTRVDGLSKETKFANGFYLFELGPLVSGYYVGHEK